MVKSRGAETYADWVKETKEGLESPDAQSDDESSSMQIDSKTIKAIKKKVKKGDIPSMKSLLSMLRTSCTDTLISEKLLRRLVQAVYKYVPQALDTMPKKTHMSVIRQLCTTTVGFLKTNTTDATINYVFTKISTVADKMMKHPTLVIKLVKTASKCWGKGDKQAKLAAYEFLRKVLQTGKLDRLTILKMLYLVYARHTRRFSWEVYDSIRTLRMTFIDLLGIDASASYQVVFQYIRQLSIHLSYVIKNPGRLATKSIITAQFFNSLCLLGASILHYPKELGQLLSPFIQLALGTCSIDATLVYAPFRLHILKLMIQIEAQAGVYVPGIAPLVLQILQNPTLIKKPKSSSLTAFDLQIALKSAKDAIDHSVYKEQIIEEACNVLTEHLATQKASVGFHEITIPIIVSLKRLTKTYKISHLRAKVQNVIKELQRNSEWVEQARAQYTPTNAPTTLSGLAPLEKRQEAIQTDRNSYILEKLESL